MLTLESILRTTKQMASFGELPGPPVPRDRGPTRRAPMTDTLSGTEKFVEQVREAGMLFSDVSVDDINAGELFDNAASALAAEQAARKDYKARFIEYMDRYDRSEAQKLEVVRQLNMVEAALRPFAEFIDALEMLEGPSGYHDGSVWEATSHVAGTRVLTGLDFKAARAALAKASPPPSPDTEGESR